MSVVQVETLSNAGIVAYQEQEFTTTQVETLSNTGQVGYQEQETTVVPLPEYGVRQVGTIKNLILFFVFSGKAYLWDGTEITEFAKPGVYVIYPQVAADPTTGQIYLIGGLQEDGTIQNELLVYGQENYMIQADADYVALVVAGDEPVIVYDDQGNVVTTIKGSGSTPLLTGWMLASRTTFIAILQKI